MASDRVWGDKGVIVILDSSAVLMVFEFSVNLEDELTRLLGKVHIVIPRPIYNEICFLAEYGKGKQKQLAKASLKLIRRYEIVEIDSAFRGDDAVIAAAEQFSGVVVTNDRDLRKRLKEKSLQSVCLRGKKRLAFV